MRASIKLSVIVPAYKLAPYIHECLLSILAQQTDFDFEVIVCDDASPDNTYDVICYLQPAFANLVVLRNEINLGLVGTMHRLLETAKGQYIAYLDGDDIALPGKLQQQVNYLEQHPGCSMVYHESEMFDSKTGDTIKFYSRDFYNYNYIPQQADITHLIKYTVFLQASSVMVRRYENMTAALEHGNSIICDFPWHIMNLGLAGGTVDRIDCVLGRYRIHQDSFGGQTQRNFQRRIKVTEELVNSCRLGNRFGVDDATIKQGVNHVYFSAALFKQVYLAFKKAEAATCYLNTSERLEEHHRYAELEYAYPTVTNLAFSFLTTVGFNNIYLFGIDFGLAEPGKHHSMKSVYFKEDGSEVYQGKITNI